ncbi:MAG: DinB family protein [Acidimicrobiia bacterium]
MEWIQGDHRAIRKAFETSIAGVVPKDQWTRRPEDQGNSIAWVIWHMARTEDVVIHAICRGQPQVLIRDEWANRIGIDEFRQGTGFSDEEIAGFGSVDIDAVDSYWMAVRAETEAWLEKLTPEELDESTPMENATAVKDQIPNMPDMLIQFWGGRPVGFLLRFSVIWHHLQHVGELQSIRGRLGYLGL